MNAATGMKCGCGVELLPCTDTISQRRALFCPQCRTLADPSGKRFQPTKDALRAADAGNRRREKYGRSPQEERTSADGEVFDSKKEMARYGDLDLLQRSGEIHGLQRQVSFKRVGKNGKIIERYIADFVYYDGNAREWVVEDAKGFKTPEYVRKRTWMREELGITIKET